MNKKTKLPAILSGKPAFAEKIPITKPTLPSLEKILPSISEVLESAMITNATYVKLLEEKLKKHLGVKHAIAVSSCTSGLMLLFKALKLKGEVILPSFTFSATGHVVLWNNLKPVFVDVKADTYNIDPKEVKKAITKRTCAILGAHIFGNPADIEDLEQIAKENNIKLFFDAAHCFGTFYKGLPIGRFGDAETFSMSPTKLLTSGEGGLVTTNNDELAYQIKIGRSYADPGNYDTQYEGLNARMSEFNAILGLESLKMLDKNVANRRKLVKVYISKLKSIPGISFQKIKTGATSSYKDFSIFIDERKFGLNRDQLATALDKENITTKKYFFPPLHKQKSFSKYFRKFDDKLQNTNKLANNILSLPLFSHMSIKDVFRVSQAIRDIYQSRENIRVL